MSDPLYKNMRWVEKFLDKVRKQRKEMNKKAIIEAVKSSARLLWFGILGVLVTALLALSSSGAISDVNISVAGYTVNLAYVILAVIAFIAKGIDSYIHNNDNIKSNGIAPSFLQK